MDIISLIIQIVLVIIPLLFIGVGALMGRKLKWQFALSKIVVIAVSAVISAIVAMVVSSTVFKALFDTIIESIGEEDLTTLVDKVESIREFACAFVAMIVAPIIYFVLFFIIRGILGLVNRLALTRLYIRSKKGEAPYDSTKARIRASGKSPWGIVLGAVCGMFLFSAIALAPISTLSVVGGAALNVADAIEDEEIGAVVGDVSKALKTNTSSVIVTVTGGRAVYGMMTTYTVSDERVSFAKETKFIGEAANTALTVSNENIANDQKAQAVRDFSISFGNTQVFPILLSDVISAASEEWDDGNEFLGIEAPSNDEGFEGILMGCITDTTKETIKEDVRALAEIVAIVIENDYIDTLEDDVMGLVENEDVTSQILLICIENERWYPVHHDFQYR